MIIYSTQSGYNIELTDQNVTHVYLCDLNRNQEHMVLNLVIRTANDDYIDEHTLTISSPYSYSEHEMLKLKADVKRYLSSNETLTMKEVIQGAINADRMDIFSSPLAPAKPFFYK